MNKFNMCDKLYKSSTSVISSVGIVLKVNIRVIQNPNKRGVEGLNDKERLENLQKSNKQGNLNFQGVGKLKIDR